MQLDTPAAERQLIFDHWVRTYQGLEDQIGLEGLERLHDFIADQLPYIVDGPRKSFRVVGEAETTHDIPGYWVELALVSHDDQDKWGRLKYLNDKRWVRGVFEEMEGLDRLQTKPVPEGLTFDPLLNVEVPPDQVACVPVGVILYAFATVFTVKALERMRDTHLDEVDGGWRHQSQLLRTAHALEGALLELYDKSNQANQPD